MLTFFHRLFVSPAILSLLLFLPTLALLLFRARRKRRQALADLGQWLSIHKLLPPGTTTGLWKAGSLFAGLSLLIVGMAGPRWGRGQMPEVASHGGDLVVVLDMSRSMLAEQPSRHERALRALRDLADSFGAHGGPRVGLVVFAAQAKIVFPLTVDYDHFRHALDQADADDLQPSLRPRSDEGSLSGTRIGAGLRMAVELHEAKGASGQDALGQQIARRDIVLLSDGDDPVADKEYVDGSEEARKSGIPVHVVGVGDPKSPAIIPFRGQPLIHGGAAVQSRLNETLLREIADRTGGIYIPGRHTNVPLGRVYRDVIAKSPYPKRPETRDALKEATKERPQEQ